MTRKANWWLAIGLFFAVIFHGQAQAFQQGKMSGSAMRALAEVSPTEVNMTTYVLPAGHLASMRDSLTQALITLLKKTYPHPALMMKKLVFGTPHRTGFAGIF